jgi:hypothetical protein
MMLADSYDLIGEIEADAGRPVEAVAPLEQAASRYDKMCQVDPANTYRRMRLAQTRSILAKVEVSLASRDGQDASNARSHFESARSWLKRSEEVLSLLQADGKLSEQGARIFADNEKQLAACDAELRTAPR